MNRSLWSLSKSTAHLSIIFSSTCRFDSDILGTFSAAAFTLIALMTGVVLHSSTVASLVPLNTTAVSELRFSSLTGTVVVTGLTRARATLTGRFFDLHSSTSQVPSWRPSPTLAITSISLKGGILRVSSSVTRACTMWGCDEESRRLIDTPLFGKRSTLLAMSSVHSLSSRKSIPKIASAVNELATSTGNLNVSPENVISIVVVPHVSSRVPSTPTSGGPVQVLNACPALFTLSQSVLSNKVTAAPVSTTKLAWTPLTRPLMR